MSAQFARLVICAHGPLGEQVLNAATIKQKVDLRNRGRSVDVEVPMGKISMPARTVANALIVQKASSV